MFHAVAAPSGRCRPAIHYFQLPICTTTAQLYYNYYSYSQIYFQASAIFYNYLQIPTTIATLEQNHLQTAIQLFAATPRSGRTLGVTLVDVDNF
jgi:hypothetical protein